MADPASYRPKSSDIPTRPGVYRFRDEHGRVIYVGKARVLRNRLASYFVNPARLTPKTHAMVFTAASVEWTVVASELEALQARVRPHFLFNTLNSGIALVRQRPEQAEELLLGLSDLFRAALARPHDVALGEELARVPVSPAFRLTVDSALRWAESGFERPR